MVEPEGVEPSTSWTTIRPTSILHFGIKIPDNNLLSYSLPPLPPLGAFDVRFDGDMRVVENGGKIKIQNQEYPITLSYNINNDENKSGDWKLLNPSSGDEYILSSSGSIEFSSPIDEIILAKENYEWSIKKKMYTL